MTQPEKLEALIERAIKCGFVGNRFFYHRGSKLKYYPDISVNDLIFNHDFAKSLWGEEKLSRDDLHAVKKEGDIFYSVDLIPVFQYRLQQAVISDEPIDYMYKEVFG